MHFARACPSRPTNPRAYPEPCCCRVAPSVDLTSLTSPAAPPQAATVAARACRARHRPSHPDAPASPVNRPSSSSRPASTASHRHIACRAQGRLVGVLIRAASEPTSSHYKKEPPSNHPKLEPSSSPLPPSGMANLDRGDHLPRLRSSSGRHLHGQIRSPRSPFPRLVRALRLPSLRGTVPVLIFFP